MSGVLEISHGSGAVVDPTAPLAMPRPDADGPVAEAQAVHAMLGTDDVPFDDDSLVASSLSPQQEGRARKKSRGEAPESGWHTPRQSPSPGPRRSLKVSSKFRAASAPRSSGRPPSPVAGRPVLRDHITVAPEHDDVPGRLAALEKQQAIDHEHIDEIVAAIRGLSADF